MMQMIEKSNSRRYNALALIQVAIATVVAIVVDRSVSAQTLLPVVLE